MTSYDNDARRLPRGTPVEVRDRLEFAFRSGFEVSQATTAGYRLRRRSDGVELPTDFSVNDVRPNSGPGTWH